MSNKICPNCGSPFMKIDDYGAVLIGCNAEENDLEALRASEGESVIKRGKQWANRDCEAIGDRQASVYRVLNVSV